MLPSYYHLAKLDLTLTRNLKSLKSKFVNEKEFVLVWWTSRLELESMVGTRLAGVAWPSC